LTFRRSLHDFSLRRLSWVKVTLVCARNHAHIDKAAGAGLNPMSRPSSDPRFHRPGVRNAGGLLLVLVLLLDACVLGARERNEALASPQAPVVHPVTFFVHRSAEADTLMDIARRYDLGFVELRAANPGIDPWQAGEGRAIVLPKLHLEPPLGNGAAARQGIVVNLAEMRLYLFRGVGAPVTSFPIGIGRDGWETPVGVTKIVRKRKDPVWVPPASIRARDPRLPAQVPPGPNNPLGAFALNLAWPSYVIHGTNKPDGVGRRVSHGCLRLYPEDIERLFELVEVGTPVTVIDQPVKVGWIGGALYLELHPNQQQALEIELTGSFTPEPLPDLRRTIESFTERADVVVDWSLVVAAARERRGIATRISR
jgi:L,D-transpeptidase ErfK/SrfK